MHRSTRSLCIDRQACRGMRFILRGKLLLSLIDKEEGKCYIMFKGFFGILLAVSVSVSAPGATVDGPSGVPIDPSEPLYLLAHLIAGEAQNCDDQEQQFVASVAMNRVTDERFPNTLEEVIYQPGQYTCTVDGNYNREPTESNWRNAQFILDNGSQLPENVVWQSNCVQGNGIYVQTQWHIYCW